MDAFAAALHSAAPAADREEALQLYGQFVGAWDGEVRFVDPSGQEHHASAEVQFGWVLEGRAIQDVWIAPARRDPAQRGRMYGTTLRVYNPARGDWEITWIEPSRDQAFERQRGRLVGDEIVQESRGENGAVTHWIFTDIEPESFRWLARRSDDDGQTWRQVTEFRFTRRVR